jgi:hypothetical protein
MVQACDVWQPDNMVYKVTKEVFVGRPSLHIFNKLTYLEAGWWMVVITDRPPSASFLKVVKRCIAVVESRPLVGSSE